MENGADGVFLINHDIDSGSLLGIYHAVRLRGDSPWFIGLNILDLETDEALRQVPDDASALWADDGGLSEVGDPASDAVRFLRIRQQRLRWDGLYFGSVAFKYRAKVENPAELARLATDYMDVVVTSGKGTGLAPDVTKIAAMRLAMNDAPLAIASGITAANIADFLPLADCFMVATGIGRSHTELDADRVRELARLIHA